MLKTIQRHIEERDLLNASQFDFRTHHSTTLQCMRLTDHVTLNFNSNMSTAAVFLEIEKAFDTTWHFGLLYKLSEFSTGLIKPIAYFLTNKKIQSFGRRRIFYIQRNTGRGVSRLRPWPSIVRSTYKRCPRGTWNSSWPVCGRYLYMPDREARTSYSLQTATRPHYSEVVVWALEHKDQWKKNKAISLK
jgi:hypothetical protein